MSNEKIIAVDREIVRRKGLYGFMRLAWPHIPETEAFLPNWHLEEICDHLQALSDGTIKNLIINIPPGMGKTLAFSVLWPAWHWTFDPGFKFLFATYDQSVAFHQSMKCRRIIQSAWYQQRWPQARITSDSKNTQKEFENTAGGFRLCGTIEAGWTGRHGDVLGVDDPMKPAEAVRATSLQLQQIIDWWGNTFYTRRANPKTTRTCVVMQRLHTNDLAGYLQREFEYEALVLPMRFDPSRRSITSVGGDRRDRDGELLFPDRANEPTVKQLEATLGPSVASAQLQQAPYVQGGQILKKEWLQRRWSTLPPNGTWFTSWDLAFEKTASTDYVVGQVWVKTSGTMYLVDQVRKRLTFEETLQEFAIVRKKWPQCTAHYVEKKANGPALQSILREHIPGIVLVEPQGSKEARARSCEPNYAAGNILHPPRESAPWWAEYEAELEQFPTGRNDDQVDATTQAINVGLHGQVDYSGFLDLTIL